MGNRKRYPYTKPLVFKKVGTGVESFYDDLVKAGRELVLTSIAVEDETTALTYIRIGKESGGTFFPWEEQQTVAADELVHSSEEHHLRGNERFECKINGGAADDIVKAYLDGYWYYTTPPKED